MLAQRYFEEGAMLLQALRAQLPHVEKAADLIAQAVADGHTFYAWGGPHSSLPVQDIFWRAGVSLLVNAVLTPGLSLEDGPIRITSAIERAEGLGTAFFAEIGAEPGDVILLVSTSGRNAFPIEMAVAAREAGLKVIALTSMAYSAAVESRHSSGRKMHEFADVILDNLTIPGDARITDDRLPAPVGPHPTVRGREVQKLLLSAIETVREKKAGDHTPAKRRYQVLYETYAENLSVDEITKKLGVSRRQYFYDLKEALEFVVHLIVNQEVVSSDSP